MKTLTTIHVQGEEQQAWEVYSDDSCSRTIGFIFDGAEAELLESMLKGRLDCKKCGSKLKLDGLCPDETCPYSDRQQDEIYTEG